jgi:hypothetical protein
MSPSLKEASTERPARVAAMGVCLWHKRPMLQLALSADPFDRTA